MTGIYMTLVSGMIAYWLGHAAVRCGHGQVRFGELVNRYATWMQQYYDALAKSNVPVMMTHDDIVWSSGPIFRPAWYREYVFPNYKRYVLRCCEAGKKIMFTSDGGYTSLSTTLPTPGCTGLPSNR